ncbi:MAG: hypothetical protein VCC00_03180 [Deltaproteobacteria bacterium]
MQHFALTAIALITTFLVAPPAVAHNDSFPIGGQLLKIDTRKAAAKHKFLFKSVKQSAIVAVLDPAVAGSKLLIRWTGANAGRTELMELDPSKWKGLGNPAGSRGYKYLDKSQAAGVKLVLWKPGGNGGMLKILGGGVNFDYEMPANPDSVEVYFGVEDEWYCAEFGGETKKAVAGFFLAKKANAPSACSESVCGNGTTEVGEQCDDGNLDETDTCDNSCNLLADCGGGNDFDTTFAGIQSVIFEGYQCTNSGCHNAAGSGQLILTEGASFGEIVGVTALQSSLSLIEPGDQDVSFLYRKLAARTIGGEYAGVAGSPMPAGSIPALSADHLEALRLWIRGGALETGVVAGTAELLGACLPDPVANKVEPLTPPDAADGVQFYGPGWDLPGESEHEVCYTTYYDLNETAAVPQDLKVPCPAAMGGPERECFKWGSNLLLQDPQSHHSIETVYSGAYGWAHSSWGGWSCLGGDLDGTSCNPTNFGVSASMGGAECGARSACSSAVRNSVACNGYGPPDYAFSLGGDTATTARFGGSQEPRSEITMPDDVFSVLPMKGYITWNSHAFNLTDQDTTLEQYFNFYFAEAGDSNQMSAIFDADDIFRMSVPTFQKQEVCGTFTLPRNSYLFELSSHAHGHMEQFRTWLPPNNTNKSDIPTGTPDYISRIYNDPVQILYDPPLHFAQNLNSTNRRIKYCAVYDNGADDISEVRRHSQSIGLVVLNSCSSSERRCLGGANHNNVCYGNNWRCDSSAGAGDGICDACPLEGGVTTFDEMLILLGSYYVPSASQAFLDTPASLMD